MQVFKCLCHSYVNYRVTFCDIIDMMSYETCAFTIMICLKKELQLVIIFIICQKLVNNANSKFPEPKGMSSHC